MSQRWPFAQRLLSAAVGGPRKLVDLSAKEDSFRSEVVTELQEVSDFATKPMQFSEVHAACWSFFCLGV